MFVLPVLSIRAIIIQLATTKIDKVKANWKYAMDPQIAARFNNEILQTALRCYNISADAIELLDGFESFIYRFTRPEGRFILRIGHSNRRNPNLIRGEVDWINYLAAHGASVAEAILSEHGNLVEAVDDGQGGEFLCTAFVHAAGDEVRPDQMNDRLYRNYGRLIGRMHALAKTYRVSNPAWERYAWDAPQNNTAERQMPDKEALALEKYHAIMSHLQNLPRDVEGYGMIHQDAHPGNFFVDEVYRLTLFDFDDCVYGHFIYDIAMVLFYTANEEQDPVEFTGRFMPVFLSGYREENRLDPSWLVELPYFMKLREIDLFAAIHYSYEDGDHPDHPWCARYMLGRRARIENELPFIEFDWLSLVQYL
jgi:amicoumacin kinase